MDGRGPASSSWAPRMNLISAALITQVSPAGPTCTKDAEGASHSTPGRVDPREVEAPNVTEDRQSPPPPRDLSEENVRAKIRTGDIASATATALLLYGADVFGFLARVLDDLDAARDVYSSFSERLWKGLSSFQWNCTL